MTITKRDKLSNLISALLIFLFVYTGTSKLLAPDLFRAPVAQSILIRNYTEQVIRIVPVTELVISILLFLPVTRKVGLFCSFLLMALFTSYVGYMLAFAKDLPCSCGGIIQKMSWPQHLIFNVLFTGLAFTGWRLSRRSAVYQPTVPGELA